jgi:hypothetical protein
LTASVGFALLGAAFGLFGAALVWQFIYSIGSSVVTDELHYQLEGTVGAWGAVAGACSGFVIAVANSRPPDAFILFVVLHVCSVLVGMFAGSSGWKGGLYGYFGMHAAAVISCGFLTVMLAAWKVIRRTSRLA